jgi:hypothetical protein
VSDFLDSSLEICCLLHFRFAGRLIDSRMALPAPGSLPPAGIARP